VPKDYAQAAVWYRKAAEQGKALAQNNLAFQYAAGHGVPQDFAQGVVQHIKPR
jgi:TPR repeat protein